MHTMSVKYTPNIIVSSPCGRVVTIATPIGITFYWTDTMNDNNNNNNRNKNNNNNNNIHLFDYLNKFHQ